MGFLLYYLSFSTLVFQIPSTGQTDWSGGPGDRELWGSFGNCFGEQIDTGWISRGVLTLGYPGGNDLLDDSFTDASFAASADLNGDGYPDLAVADNHGTGTLSLFINQAGSGIWQKQTITSGQEYYRGLDAADIDGDGDQDLVIGFSYTSPRTVAWLENPGWTLHEIAELDNLVGIDCGDWDMNGTADILCCCLGDSSLSILVNPGTGGSWTSELVTAASTGVRSALFADMNQNGFPDVLAALHSSSRAVWYENGAGWAEHTVCSISSPRDISSGDYDSNGTMDVLAAGTSEGAAILCTGLNGSGLSWTVDTLLQASENADVCLFLDMNDDGDMECAVAQRTDSTTILFTNNGTSSEVWSQTGFFSEHPRDFVSIDSDMDGHMELACLSKTTLRILHTEPGAYITSGSLSSLIVPIPAGTDYSEWGNIYWNADVPDGTGIQFQLRGGPSPSAMGEWSPLITESGSYIGDFMSPVDWYLQYRVLLSSDSPDTSPVLYDVEVEGWSPGSIEDMSSAALAELFRVNTNPSSATAVTVAGHPARAVELAVYDLAGREVRRTVIQPNSDDTVVQLEDLPSGTYSIVVRRGTAVQTERICILRE